MNTDTDTTTAATTTETQTVTTQNPMTPPPSLSPLTPLPPTDPIEAEFQAFLQQYEREIQTQTQNPEVLDDLTLQALIQDAAMTNQQWMDEFWRSITSLNEL